MELETKDILLGLRSILELQEDFSSGYRMLKELPEYHIAVLIENEIKRRNYGNAISIIDKLLYELDKIALYEKNDIKQFNFTYLDNITIEEIKILLEIHESENYKKSIKIFRIPWANKWYNTGRYFIVINITLLEKVILNPKMKLQIKKETYLAKLGYYNKLTISEYSGNNYSKPSFDQTYNVKNWLEDAAGTNDPEVMRDVYWNLD